MLSIFCCDEQGVVQVKAPVRIDMGHCKNYKISVVTESLNYKLGSSPHPAGSDLCHELTSYVAKEA